MELRTSTPEEHRRNELSENDKAKRMKLPAQVTFRAEGRSRSVQSIKGHSTLLRNHLQPTLQNRSKQNSYDVSRSND